MSEGFLLGRGGGVVCLATESRMVCDVILFWLGAGNDGRPRT